VLPLKVKVPLLSVPLSTNRSSTLLVEFALAVLVVPLFGIAIFIEMCPLLSTSSTPTRLWPENITTACPGSKSCPSIARTFLSDPAVTLELVDAVDVALPLVLLLALVALVAVEVALEDVVFAELMLLVLLLVVDVAFEVLALFEALVALPLLVDVPFALSSTQLPEDAVPVWSDDAVFVWLAASAAISVSVMTFTEIVGVPVVFPTDAVLVWLLTFMVPTLQMIMPSNRLATEAVDALLALLLVFVAPVELVLAVLVAFEEVVELSSVPFWASSSNVVIWPSSLAACAEYIEMPTKAVDITTTADKSDSNVNFVFRSLNTFTQTVCH